MVISERAPRAAVADKRRVHAFLILCRNEGEKRDGRAWGGR